MCVRGGEWDGKGQVEQDAVGLLEHRCWERDGRHGATRSDSGAHGRPWWLCEDQAWAKFQSPEMRVEAFVRVQG